MLSIEKEVKGLLFQRVGLGTAVNIPKNVVAKRIRPSHTVHQSSDFIRDVKIFLEEMPNTFFINSRLLLI